MSRIFPVAALIAAVPFCAGIASADGDLARQVTIYRDAYGVPHVYARSDAGVVFGMMYAQAEDNFWQLEAGYIRAIGRAAEVEGPSALAHDVLVRAYQVQKMASDQYDQADPPIHAMCDAFADGINFFLETHPEVKPRLLTHFEPWYVLALEYAGPWGASITRAERERAFPALVDVPDPQLEPGPDEGSNMWAIAPSRSASGHAMLLINPYIGFFSNSQRYEAHLHSDDGLDISGFAILGTPYIRSGHNSHLGWSHTNNYAQTSDVYAEKFDDPKDPLSYHYGRSHRKAEQWTEEIKVKTASGMETRSVVFRKTQHGPILGVRPPNANGVVEQLAVHFAGADGGVMVERWAMAKAKNLKEFKEAMAQMALTGSNTMYADTGGNIFYLHGDAIPKRLVKFDWSKPVDGSNPETDWDGKHALADLPQVLNPPSGWMQNCNSTPFLTTVGANPDPTKYPAYMAPEDDTERAKRSRAILSGTAKFSFDEWAKAAMDTKMGLAATRIPEVQQAFAKLQQSDAARAGKLKDLVGELASWDQVGRIDSVASTLFVLMETHAIELRRQNASDPLLLMNALDQAKAALEKDWGTWRVKWGDINRMQRIHTSGTLEKFSDEKPSLPVPGAPSFAGAIFTFGAHAVPGQKRWYGTTGDTYVGIVEFSSHPETRSVLVFGESADPQSKHFLDQAELYSTGQFKPAWFDIADIRKHLDKSYRPGQEK